MADRMSAVMPVVLTVSEAEELIALFRDLETSTEIRGYGRVCVDCGCGIHEQPHAPTCKIASWLKRLEPWEKGR